MDNYVLLMMFGATVTGLYFGNNLPLTFLNVIIWTQVFFNLLVAPVALWIKC